MGRRSARRIERVRTLSTMSAPNLDWPVGSTQELINELEQELRDLKTSLIFEKDLELIGLHVDLVAQLEIRVQQLMERQKHESGS